MDSWCTPQRVCDAYLPDEVTDFQRHLRPPCSGSGFPAPQRTESMSVPADHRLGFDDRQGIQDTRRQPIQPDKEEPVSVAEDQSFRSLPVQHIKLMAQGADFRLAVNPRSKKSSDGAPDQTQNAYHHRQASPNILSLASQIRFTVGTAISRPVRGPVWPPRQGQRQEPAPDPDPGARSKGLSAMRGGTSSYRSQCSLTSRR